MKLQRFSQFSSRVIDNGVLIGFALQLANGRWGAFDPQDRRLSKLSFASAKDVLAYFKLAGKALEGGNG